MEQLIGKTVIFQTKRKTMRDNTLKAIFPEHTFSATIMRFVGDFVLIQDTKLLVGEGEYGRKLNLIARDKLYFNRPNNSNIDTHSIKITNNMYFDVYIYNQNTDLLKSIENHNWFPNLFDICFYNLSSMEINFVRKMLNIY